MSDIYITPTTPEDENIEPETGTCRFCGQVQSVSNVPPIGDFKDNFVAADELATLQCDCDQAQDYQSYTTTVKKVEDMFSDNDEAVGMIKSLVRDVHDRIIQSATVQIDPKIKVRVNRTTKNKLKVKRTNTETQNIET